jgi:TP901 family phage tail tape measure protein
MAIDIKLVLKAATDSALKKIKDLDTNTEKLKNTFASIGKVSGIAFASISAGVGLAVKSFATFDNKMRGVKTLLDKTSFGAKDLESGFKEMSMEALKLSSTVPVALDSLTTSLFDTVSAGIDASDAVEVLGVSSSLAVAGLTDVSTATNGMTSALNAYSLGADDAENVASKFFAAQKKGKCFAKGTKILLSNGENKKVEDIIVGDKLMGDDNTPRNVLALGRGNEMMYKITMRDGSNYTVNESHILSLKRHAHKKDGRSVPLKITNLTVKEYLTKSNDFKVRNLGYKTSIELKEQKVHIDPYLLGLWLGDGNTDSPRFCTMDKEVVDYLAAVSKLHGWNFKEYIQKDNKSNLYSLTKDRICRGKGSFTELLNKYNLLGNKYIPKEYLINSRDNRLKLLAGLIDTDGYLNRPNDKSPNSYEFSNKNKNMIDSFIWIARSCGFYCRMREKIIDGCIYYLVYVSGDVHNIPCKVERRKCKKEKSAKRDILCQSFKIEKLKADDYYGFEIDGNKLFILNNFNVTHNTTIAELSDGFGLVGATASAVGVSLDELLSAVSAVTTAGVKTNSAYTGLKATLSNILKPTKEAQKEAKRLGVEFNAGALRAKGFKGFLDDLTSSTKFTKDSIIQLFGSVEAQNIMFALTGNQASNFSDTLKVLGNETESVSTFTKAFETQNESLTNQFKILMNKVSALTIILGEQFAPIVKSSTIAIGNFLDKIADNKDLIKYGAIAISVAGGVVALTAGLAAAAVAATSIATALGVSATATLAVGAASVVASGGIAALTAKIIDSSNATESQTERVKELDDQLSNLREEQEKNNAALSDNTGRIYHNKEEISDRNEEIKNQIKYLEELRTSAVNLEKVTPISLMRPKTDKPEELDVEGLFAPLIAANENANQTIIEKNREKNAILLEQEEQKTQKDLIRAEAKKERELEELATKQEFDDEMFSLHLATLDAQNSQVGAKTDKDTATRLIKLKKAKKDQELERTKTRVIELQNAGKHDQAKALIEKTYQDRQIKNAENQLRLEQATSQARVNIISSTATLITAVMGRESKIAFYAQKAAALAQAIVATHLAMAQALLVPPPPNYALATMAKIAGGINIAAIAATTIKGMARGGLVEGGIAGVDSVPMIAQRGEIVAPRSNFDEVIGSVRAKREADKISSTEEIEETKGPIEIMIGFTEDAFEIIEDKLIERQAIGISNL